MHVVRIDHLVLTVADIEVTVEFYCSVLGMQRVQFGSDRIALKFGDQKINLHQAGGEFEPHARNPSPGSGDLCFIADSTRDEIQGRLRRTGVKILEGPVQRTGATGPIESVYFHDPDGNLIEVSIYL